MAKNFGSSLVTATYLPTPPVASPRPINPTLTQTLDLTHGRVGTWPATKQGPEFLFISGGKSGFGSNSCMIAMATNCIQTTIQLLRCHVGQMAEPMNSLQPRTGPVQQEPVLQHQFVHQVLQTEMITLTSTTPAMIKSSCNTWNLNCKSTFPYLIYTSTNGHETSTDKSLIDASSNGCETSNDGHYWWTNNECLH